jgi:hypothetical protein
MKKVKSVSDFKALKKQTQVKLPEHVRRANKSFRDEIQLIVDTLKDPTLDINERKILQERGDRRLREYLLFKEEHFTNHSTSGFVLSSTELEELREWNRNKDRLILRIYVPKKQRHDYPEEALDAAKGLLMLSPLP